MNEFEFECAGCEDEENAPHSRACEKYNNPYAPKYYIVHSWPTGEAQFITAGNANPPKVATFSENDVEDVLSVMHARNPGHTFHKAPIEDRTLHL